MNYLIQHRTAYGYSEPASLGHSQARLTPRTFGLQRCLSSRITVQPAPTAWAEWEDYFGNRVAYFTVEQEHAELTITARAEVQLDAPRYPAANQTVPWEQVRSGLAGPRNPEPVAAAQFLFDSPHVGQDAWIHEYARPSFSPNRPLLEAVLDLTARIHREFRYTPASTNVSTPIRQVFEQRRGVCQDFAHLQIACLRSLGLAARYVSGYLLTDPPAGSPKLVGTDASHAWLSVYCPGVGWVDVDPTNNQLPSDRHVTAAWGRDYSDVCPVKGVVLGGGQHLMSVAVDVTPLA
jgi:transglutaminase-like putative cysteine protease